MSAVSDAYGKAGLAPAQHRLAMCEAAADSCPLTMVDTWEGQQPVYTPTLRVLKRVRCVCVCVCVCVLTHVYKCSSVCMHAPMPQTLFKSIVEGHMSRMGWHSMTFPFLLRNESKHVAILYLFAFISARVCMCVLDAASLRLQQF